ncbi:MAG: PQQ-binding-like beta-propeller repeat protein [Planctomycetaceae bacterium]
MIAGRVAGSIARCLHRTAITAAVFALAGWTVPGWNVALAADWARFRGPNGTGIAADDQATPVEWSPDQGVKWKAELPGPGVSSPIVVGDRVFVTCYSGYGLDRENPGEIRDLKRHLVCVDVASGNVLWDKTVDVVLPEDPYSGIGVPAHGYASHTPASDGERVYAFFGKSGVVAFDMDGNQLWQTNVGSESDSNAWGSSSSPIVYGNLVIVTAAAESRALVGLDGATGKEVWKQEAESLDNMWGTPALVELQDGRTDLVLLIPFEMWGLNPDNGKLRWYAEATGAQQANASVVVDDDSDVLYAVTSRNGGSVALKAGGKGDVTATQTVWSETDTGSFPSPVLYEGRLYSIANGTISVIDAESGTRLSQTRLAGGTSPPGGEGRGGGGGRGGRGGGRGGFGGRMDYPSPVIADGKLYYLKGDGEMHVFRPGDEPESLAVNKVTEDSESFGGTPAISNGRIFLRSDKHLYCVAKE